MTEPWFCEPWLITVISNFWLLNACDNINSLTAVLNHDFLKVTEAWLLLVSVADIVSWAFLLLLACFSTLLLFFYCFYIWTLLALASSCLLACFLFLVCSCLFACLLFLVCSYLLACLNDLSILWAQYDVVHIMYAQQKRLQCVATRYNVCQCLSPEAKAI